MSGGTPTPGPWTCTKEGLVNGFDSRKQYANSPSIDIFDAQEWPAEQFDEALCNAHLIAAAPEMYEALASVLKRSALRCCFEDDELELYEAILAKARGEQP